MTAPKLIASMTLGLSLSLAFAAQAASPIGKWQTASEKGQVEFFDCGGKLCGRALPDAELLKGPALKDSRNKNPALRERPLNGLQIISDFAGGPVAWTGGAIYRPEDGNTYKGRIELLDANTLKMTGCVIEPLCKSYVWKRVP
jgi:uncharacterized protein (DUF2147 family)